MAVSIPPFSTAQLESICKIVADTADGFTGAEIARLLAERGIADPDSANTKWKRLYSALAALQGRDGAANGILHFLQHAMEPARYFDKHGVFEDRRAELNSVLAFAGFKIHEDGKIKRVEVARTISEAQDRASRLRAGLTQRRVHHDVIRFCNAELLEENYFHAVLEATKSLVRSKAKARSSA
jgi:hypothetical protein